MEKKHNHHILPKFYLKGFVEIKDKPFIWEYRKGMQFSPGMHDKYNPCELPPLNRPELG
jgi:hypothetical protein